MRQPWHPVLALVLLLCSGMAMAVEKKPQQVLDLQYGEVLFHFYQDDYFTAITHLMAAQQRQQLPHHAREAELLLGGLQLSYGMRSEAQRQFEAVLDEQVDRDVRNRAWHYLARIAYQRDRLEEAQASLRQVSGGTDPHQSAEVALLKANISMLQGADLEAATVLDRVRAPQPVTEYLRINRAIALLRAGQLEAGRELLDDIGRQRADSEELRALRDRANLGLGYGLLQSGEAEQARHYLNRVRLKGPYAAAALLGAGWADVERGAYDAALVPWQELAQRQGFDAPVQEAQLAIPYAFEKLGEQSRAIHFYQTAIRYFDAEEQSLTEAVAAVQAGQLIDLLSQADDGQSGGWLQRSPTPEDLPARQYLVDLLAGHPFQEMLKNYRDLTFLNRLTRQRLDYIAVMQDMVEARRLAHEQRGPEITARLQQNEAAATARRWQDLQQRWQAQQQARDPLGLASAVEQQQWQRLNGMLDRLAALPDEARYREMATRARWLKGVLYWNLQADYEQRLWQVRKGLQALQEPVQQAEAGHARVAGLLSTRQDSFRGYENRIATLQARLTVLQPPLQSSLVRAGDILQQLALQELETRRTRLVSYRNQARYALARNFDQLAKQQAGTP